MREDSSVRGTLGTVETLETFGTKGTRTSVAGSISPRSVSGGIQLIGVWFRCVPWFCGGGAGSERFEDACAEEGRDVQC